MLVALDTLYSICARPKLEYCAVSSFEALLTTMDQKLLRYFFAFWAIDNLVLLSSLSMLLRGVYRRYQGDVWNIDRFLRSWFPDAARFRRVMGGTGAVIAGSQALQFFDRTRYMDSDLDIFLRVGGAIMMGRYLENEGFQFEGKSEAYPFFADKLLRTLSTPEMFEESFEPSMVGVHNFVKFLGSRDGIVRRMQVQLIVLRSDPIRHIMCGFHSSTSLIWFCYPVYSIC